MTARLVVVAACFSVACTDVGPPEFTQPVTLGGKTVDVATLNKGRRSYNHYCANCHGPKGDGLGPLGIHQKPPAADLRPGIIKFASVPAGSLPTDADLKHVIRHGVRGTAMLGWDVPDDELDAVAQYIKFFSPRWRKQKAGTPIELSPDPWSPGTQDAVARGNLVYHGDARCGACHPSYGTHRAPRNLLTATRFGQDVLKVGDDVESIYRVIAAGVGGTEMPTWKGVMPEKDVWALAHYIRFLNSGPEGKP